MLSTENETIADMPAYRMNFAPVGHEVDVAHLAVLGELPPGLEGLLVRNGPNPLFPDSKEHWFAGDGMVHGFEFRGGKVRYWNRWVRTRRWLAEKETQAKSRAGLEAQGPENEGIDDGTANTNIVFHGGRLLALEEAHLPIEIHAASLATSGPIDFNRQVNGPFTAHPKIDPRTGEMLFFGYGTPDWLSAGMSYGTIDANGEVTRFDRFNAPYASMAHDFMFTQHHVLFPVMPLTASASRAQSGLPPFAWEPEYGTRVGVMRRDAGVDTIQWWSGPACYVFHVMNSWETPTHLYADVMQFPTAPLFPWPDGRPIENQESARLTRWRFDLTSKERVIEQKRLSELRGEFPRIDDRFAGMPYRHGWLAAHAEDAPFSRLVHFDHHNASPDVYDLPALTSISEPVFVPRENSASEGDGWILTVAFRGERQLSELLVFDALQIAAGPLATVSVPYRVPNGFHGNWIAASLIGRRKS
jgi:carotenoid cleavage dioxygenase-like enzyme